MRPHCLVFPQKSMRRVLRIRFFRLCLNSCLFEGTLGQNCITFISYFIILSISYLKGAHVWKMCWVLFSLCTVSIEASSNHRKESASESVKLKKWGPNKIRKVKEMKPQQKGKIKTRKLKETRPERSEKLKKSLGKPSNTTLRILSVEKGGVTPQIRNPFFAEIFIR